MTSNEGEKGEGAITYEKIVFCDGSTYVGTLKGMQPDGLGTCTWKDGNQYDGEWKAGAMHGFGTYMWTSGQRYDGEWKDGRREGIGVKRYADGSTFDGFWKDGKKHGVGVFRPAQALPASHAWGGGQQNSKREPLRISLSRQRSQQHTPEEEKPQDKQQPKARGALAKQRQLDDGLEQHTEHCSKAPLQNHQQQQQQQQQGKQGPKKEGQIGMRWSVAESCNEPAQGQRLADDCKPSALSLHQLPVISRHTSGGLLLPHDWQLPKYGIAYLVGEGEPPQFQRKGSDCLTEGSSPPLNLPSGTPWSRDHSPSPERHLKPRSTFDICVSEHSGSSHAAPKAGQQQQRSGSPVCVAGGEEAGGCPQQQGWGVRLPPRPPASHLPPLFSPAAWSAAVRSEAQGGSIEDKHNLLGRISEQPGSAVYVGERDMLQGDNGVGHDHGGVAESTTVGAAHDSGECSPGQPTLEFSFDKDKKTSVLRTTSPPPPIPPASSMTESLGMNQSMSMSQPPLRLPLHEQQSQGCIDHVATPTHTRVHSSASTNENTGMPLQWRLPPPAASDGHQKNSRHTHHQQASEQQSPPSLKSALPGAPSAGKQLALESTFSASNSSSSNLCVRQEPFTPLPNAGGDQLNQPKSNEQQSSVSPHSKEGKGRQRVAGLQQQGQREGEEWEEQDKVEGIELGESHSTPTRLHAPELPSLGGSIRSYESRPVTRDAVAALETQQLRQHMSAFDLGAGLRRFRQQAKSGHAADSVLTGPPHTNPSDGKVLYIRRFNEGKLEREDKFTHEEMKEIFQDVWTKPNKAEPRTKAIGRHMKRALGIGKKLEEKQGQLIYKGMPGYDLMIRLQVGIRYSIGRVNQVPVVPVSTTTPSGAVTTVPQAVEVPLTAEDFTYKAKVFFPMSGSSTTPAHPSSDFKWKDYSPRVFRHLRAAWGVNDAEYMLSLGGSQALRQLNSPGKSGCMFFLSDDEHFLIKTMRKNELKILVDMLPMYFKHMEAHPQSLVTHFFGVHGVKDVHGRTVRFMVMSNIFCTELQIHKKFDLKGSTFERTAGAANPNDPKSVFKDLDLDVSFKLPKELHDRLGQQFGADAGFLKAIGVMDYSLLLGVHFCARGGHEAMLPTATSARHEPQLDRQASTESSKPGRDSDVNGHASSVARGVAVYGPTACPATPCYQDLPNGFPSGMPHSQYSHLHHHSRAPSGTPSCGTPVKPAAIAPNATPGKLDMHAPHAAVGGGKGASPCPPANGGVLRPIHTRRWQSDSVAESAGSTTRTTDQQQSALQGSMQESHHNRGISLYTPHRTKDGNDFGSEWNATVHASKNFDIFSNREELSVQLAAVKARMRQLKYSEQRIQDVLGLAKLKILGDKLNKRDLKKVKGQRTQSRAVGAVRAIAQARQETDAEESTNATSNAPPLATPFMHAAAAAMAAGLGQNGQVEKVALPLWQRGAEDRPSGGVRTHLPFTLLIGDGDSASGSDSDLDAGTTAQECDGTLPPASSMIHSNAVSLVCQRTQLGFNMPATATHHPPLHVLEQQHKARLLGRQKAVSRSAQGSLSFDEVLVKGKPNQGDSRFGCFGGGIHRGSHPPLGKLHAPDKHIDQGASRTQAPVAEALEPVGEAVITKGSPVLGGQVAGEGEEEVEEEVLLYFGIIDILQEYNSRKLFERGVKSLMHDKHAISVAPPDLYASRFMDFMHRQVFTQPLLNHQAPLHALALSASLMRAPMPLPLPHGHHNDPTHHAYQTQQGCYNYFINAIGQRLDQQLLRWGSTDLDTLNSEAKQPSVDLTVREDQPGHASAEPEHNAASEDVRVEVVA